MSLFITFEGGEGSGKSSQARALYGRLSALALPAIITHEPGGTSFGDKLAQWLKWGKNLDVSPLAELFLFSASRIELVTRVIKLNLEGGKIVICDRYSDSTIAYQGYGRGIDLDMVKLINSAANQGIKPDITVLLDIPVGDGLARKGYHKDRFEQENLTFHQRVRDGYLRLAANEPEHWLVIDATQTRDKIEGIIWQRVREMLPDQEG
jgi:dTMP kinase